MFSVGTTAQEQAAEETLLEAMRLPRNQTLYGVALSGRAGDKQATQILAAHIMQQRRETKIPEVRKFEVRGIRHYDERHQRTADLSEDWSLPNELCKLFSTATSISNKLLRDFRTDFRIASPDVHHFNCRVTGRHKGQLSVEFTDTSRLYAPGPIHFATLLMNPFNPLDKKKRDFALDPERMERQADLLQDVTGVNRDDLLMAAFVTSVHMTGVRLDEFRHGLALQPQQGGHEHYLEMARVVNKVGIIGLKDEKFDLALAAIRTLRH